jgi:ketosteroid isomerase-like protein
MEPIVKTLLETLQAFNEEDFASIAERVDAEVTYRIPGQASISGEFHGVEAVTTAFRRLREHSGGTISVQPQVVLSDGEHVMFTARVTAEHQGRSLDVVNAYVFRFRDGKLLQGQVFPSDLHAVEAFFR